MPFRDVVGNRNRGPPHLHGQRVLFLKGKLLQKTVSALSKCPSNLIELEVVKFITTFFHIRTPQPTTHLLTTHLLTYSPLTYSPTHHSPTHSSNPFVLPRSPTYKS